MTTTRYTPEFVESFPTPLAAGVFYVSLEYNTCAHLCACGCGDEAVTPLSPAQWSFTYDGESISVRPSVGNWSLPASPTTSSTKVALSGHAASLPTRSPGTAPATVPLWTVQAPSLARFETSSVSTVLNPERPLTTLDPVRFAASLAGWAGASNPMLV